MGDQCLPAFAFKLFCVPEHAPPPLHSRSVFRRFMLEAVVQNQNYHINQNTNV